MCYACFVILHASGMTLGTALHTHTRTPTRKSTQDCVESPALGMFHALIEDKLCFRLNQKEGGVDYIVLDGELLQLQEEGIKKDHLTQPS